MVGHLGGIAKERLILSFAPDTWYYRALKRFGGPPPPPAKAAAASPPTPAAAARAGELFPGPSKTTRAYLHTEEAVLKASETIRDSPRPDAALKSESSLGQLCHTPYTRPPAATRGPEQP